MRRVSLPGPAPSVNDRVAQNYVRGELYLTGGLITVGVGTTNCRQRYANGDNDELSNAGRHFSLRRAGRIQNVSDVALAAGVNRRVVSNFFVVVTEDQRIDAIGKHRCLVRSGLFITHDVALAQ